MSIVRNILKTKNRMLEKIKKISGLSNFAVCGKEKSRKNLL